MDCKDDSPANDGPTSTQRLSCRHNSLILKWYRWQKMAWDVRIWRPMVNRRQAIDVVGLIVQLAGFIVLLSLFFPAVRRGLAEHGLLAVCLSLLAIMTLIGFSIYRLVTWQNSMAVENPFASPDEEAGPAGNSDPTMKDDESEAWTGSESKSMPELLAPALRRRYPWRHEVADHP